jgi:hypothetical protein
MTLAAHSITDAEVTNVIQELGTQELARLVGGCLTISGKDEAIRTLGRKQLVALVQLLAYANFQDRLLLTLGVSQEPGGPLPAQRFRFAAPKETAPTPRSAQADAQSEPTASEPGRVTDPEWQALNFDELQRRMEGQRARQGRIPVPTWEEMHKASPRTYPADRRLRIRWSLACLWYQPELATAWGACMRAFAQEARQDRVFEESLFWVVTRSLNCFY